MAAESTKRERFDRGAAAFARVRPGMFDAPTYPWPCLTPFTVEAVAGKRLSVEHVPPKSVGGRELLLTCTVCNNSSGTKLDASAKTKEDVLLAMAGDAGRPHRIRTMIGEVRLNGELRTSSGKYSLQIPPHINKPGTAELLKDLARAGTRLVVEHERYSELGARMVRISSAFRSRRVSALVGSSHANRPKANPGTG